MAGWTVLVSAGAAIDHGEFLPGPGPSGAFLALALGAPLAALVAVWSWSTAALRSTPALGAIGAALGIAAWSALSIVWAAAPDLAWIDANRAAIAACALVIGIGAGALVPRAPKVLALAVAAGALVPVAIALGSKVFPAIAGSDRDLARLSAPVGYWNALALVAVFAIPGLLWLTAAAREQRRRYGPALSGAGLALVLCTILLTYSRGGLVAAAVAATITLALLPGTWRGLAALLGGAMGALVAGLYALSHPALSTDLVAVAEREGPGLGLGWRLAMAMAIGGAVASVLPALAERSGLDTPRLRRALALGCVALAGLGVLAALASPDGRGWMGDRWAEVRDAESGAVANDPTRLASASGNQRAAWWGQAWRGFRERPAVGQGAGGFRLVHLQQRTRDRDDFITAETHDVILRTMSGLGLVGLALLVTLIGSVGVACRRALRAPRVPEIGLPLALLAAFAAQAMIDWSWAIPGLAIPAFGAAGVVIAAAAPGRPAGRGRRPGPLAIAALACATLVAIVSAVMPWWSVRLTDSAERALADGRPGVAVERAQAAQRLNPLALGPLRTKAAALTAVGERGRALGVYLEMTEVQPANPAAWRVLARFYGSDPRAVPAWERVLELSPLDRAARAALARP